jgi:hypothetical protein
MTIAVVYKPPAMTAEQYKESWREGSPVALPAGLIFHAGVGDGDEFFTLTVWESAEAYEAFAPLFARSMRERGLHIGSPRILPVHQSLVPSQ